MATLVSESTLKKQSQLRPFDMRRDLLAVADLVELCFRDTLDGDGRLYIHQMRRTAQNSRLLSMASASAVNSDMPPGGFVWEEGGQLIGNLSLIPIAADGKRYYLIANVAVHPDHRRRGIASQLTHVALDQALATSANQIWLQVDHSNQAAINLYQHNGFVEKAHRIAWIAQPLRGRALNASFDVPIRGVKSEDWEQAEAWLQANYPDEVRWNLPLKIKQFQPGFSGSVQRLLGNRQYSQWAAEWGGECIGVLCWQSSTLTADRLWLASNPEGETLAIPALLSQAHSQLKRGRKMLLNYQAGRGENLFEEFGFRRLRQLKWMQYTG